MVANVPVVAFARVTSSVPTLPTNVAPVMAAVALPSYGLDVTTASLTVNSLAVIVPVSGDPM